MSLDKLQASLAAAGIKPPPSTVEQRAAAGDRQQLAGDPRADRRRAGAEARARPLAASQRVINTRALILQGGFGDNFYIHVYDGWLRRASITGPWTQASLGPLVRSELDDDRARARQEQHGRPADRRRQGESEAVARQRRADDLHERRRRPSSSCSSGQPDFVPIVGTQLLWASNTTSDVLIDTANSNYYVLLAGRWFRSAALTGPWTFVAEQRAAGGLREDPAGVARGRGAADRRGHAAGAGRGDRELDSADGDGAAEGRPDVHAQLRRSAAVRADRRTRRCRTSSNSSVPIIQVVAERVLRGHRRRVVHRAAAHRAVDGRDVGAGGHLHDSAVVAAPLRDVRAHLRHDAAVRLRRLHAGLPRHGRVAVRHRRLRHRLRVLAVDRQRLVSAAVHVLASPRTPVYNPYVGFTYGFAMGLATAAWTVAVLGRRVLPPGLLGRLSVLRVGERQRVRALGHHDVFRHAHVVRRRRRRRHDGERQLLQQPHRNVGHVQRGPPVQRVDRQRVARLRPHGEHGGRRLGQRRARQQLQHYTGQRSTGSSVSATGAGGSTYERTGATTAGPEGYAHAGEGSTYNAKTGNTNTWDTASVGNNHYADVNGNVYKNTGDGWQQHSSSGWSQRRRRHVVGEPRIAGAQPAATASAAAAGSAATARSAAERLRRRRLRRRVSEAVAAAAGAAASAVAADSAAVASAAAAASDADRARHAARCVLRGARWRRVGPAGRGCARIRRASRLAPPLR